MDSIATATKSPNACEIRFFAAAKHKVFARADIASLVFFRIAFGTLLFWSVWIYFANHWVSEYWIRPHFFLKYFGFSWVAAWPGSGLYIHWGALGILALFVAIGFLYRLSAVLLFLSYAYFFLLDEACYMNHAYLICLFSFLFIFIPANRAFSVDVVLNRRIRSDTVPAWSLWLFRVQIAVVYIYGGIAKLNPDWLRGEPMRARLARRPDFPLLGRFFHEEWMVYLMSYGGLLLDLLIVPLLLWRRTRLPAFSCAVGFHLVNARLFNIDVFPWLAIAATSLFFPPDWPRRALSLLRIKTKAVLAAAVEIPSRSKRRVIFWLSGVYVGVQILLPLRPFLLGSGADWIYAEHRFCWRMMLRDQFVQGYFYVTDPNNHTTLRIDPARLLSASQRRRIYWQPDMILQIAHYLAERIPPAGPQPPIVEARLFMSINGRKPELFVDPNVNLAGEPRTLTRPRWLLPLHEPLPPNGQDLSEDVFGQMPGNLN